MSETRSIGPIGLSWDWWNRDHITKHEVAEEEVEEAIAGDPIFRAVRKGRLLVIGPTRRGRILAVVIGPVPGRSGLYYPFSARPASRQERRRYQEMMGEDEA